MSSNQKNRETGMRASLPLPALLTGGRVSESRLSSTADLRRFFGSLERLDHRQASEPVRVLQICDSHTANDAFSGRLRERMQARFGAAGRGWLPSGIPFQHYRPQLVRVAQTGWRQFGVGDGAPVEAFGIDATVAQSERRDARMTLVSSEAEGFSRIAIEFLAQPNGGTLSIRADRQRPVRISTSASTRCATRRVVPIGERAHQVELRTIDERPVYLIGWTTERQRDGIIYENHGTIGATVDLLGQMSPATVAHELCDSCPALIVIAFGTNEGFDAELNLPAYEARFLGHVAALRHMAPQAAILVLGPPDGNQVDQACPAEAPDNGSSAAAGPARPPDSCAWREPRHLAAVRQVQRTVAAEMGWAFWDWSQTMGGTGSMHQLVLRDPPLALPDHVHLNKLGYAATADVLFFDLIGEYQEWLSRRRA